MIRINKATHVRAFFSNFLSAKAISLTLCCALALAAGLIWRHVRPGNHGRSDGQTSASLAKTGARAGNGAPNQTDPKVQAQVRQAYGRIPLSFESNQGQADTDAKFLSRGSGFNLLLKQNQAVLQLQKAKHVDGKPDGSEPEFQTAEVKLTLAGANPKPILGPEEDLPGKINYLLGDDPKAWHTDIKTFAKVRYQSVYPGIDMVFYGNQRQLEYDFVVAPGRDPKEIKLDFTGADNISLDADGNLILKLGDNRIVQHKPVVYQESEGQQHLLAGNYVILGAGQVGFAVGAYDNSRPLVIDPTLAYSTYFGGTGATDSGMGIAVDSKGNAYVTGAATTGLATTAGAFQTTFGAGTTDAFVAKINPNGAVVYVTYIGGSGNDQGNAIAVDSTGNAYIAGSTNSGNFPKQQPLAQVSSNGTGGDAFVTELNTTGSALVFSTYLGGRILDDAHGIALDSSNNVYVTGETTSTDFPTSASNAFQLNKGQGKDAFFCKLTFVPGVGLTLPYSTYFGAGTSTAFDDIGLAIAVDSNNMAYIAGSTASNNLPVNATGVVQSAYGGGATDGFIAEFDATKTGAASKVFSTYFGNIGDDDIRGIAVDNNGSLYITGQTSSNNFLTTSGFQATYGGGASDGYVAALKSNGSSINYLSYIGGNDSDTASGIAVDKGGIIYVTGSTSVVSPPSTFPTNNPFQAQISGPQDAFVAKIDTTRIGPSSLIYSSFLGGSSTDAGNAIAIDTGGQAYITGSTTSTDYPTKNPLQAAIKGTGDAIIAKISDTASGGTCSVFWNGQGGNNLWTTAANWNTGQVPGPTDDVCIASGFNITVPSGSQAANSLTSASPITISGGTLSLSTKSAITSTLQMTGGTLAGTGTLDVSGLITWMSNTMSGTGITNANGGIAINSGNVTLDTRTLNIVAPSTWSAGGIALTNNSTINIQVEVPFDNSFDGSITKTGTSGGAINVSGTFQKSAGTAKTIVGSGVTFNNSVNGLVVVQTGTLSLQGGGNDDGPLTIQGGTLDFGGGTHILSSSASIRGGGTVSFSAGQVDLNGSYGIDGDTFVNPTALVNFNTTGTALTNNITQTGGTLSGTSELDTQGGGVYTWSGGTNSIAILSTTAGMALSGTGLSHTAGTITLGNTDQGASTWTGASDLTQSAGAVINNSSGATFTCQTTVGLSGGAFNNSGSFIRSGNSGTSTISSTFNNTGSVDVQLGELNLTGSGTSSGSFMAETTAILNFGPGANHVITGNVNGVGTVGITGGTVNFNSAGVYNVTGTTSVAGGTMNFNTGSTTNGLTISGGTLGGTANLNETGTFTWSGGAMAGTGSTDVNGIMTISGPVTLDTRKLSLHTSSSWTAAADMFFANGALFDILSTGTLTAQNDQTIQNGGGGGGTLQVEASGSFSKNGTNGTTSFASGVTFNNFGSVVMVSGTLGVNGGGSSTGSFAIQAGTTVGFNAGTFNFNTGTAFSSTGTLLFGGATVTNNVASLSFGNPLTMTAGTLNGAGNLIVGGLFTWQGGIMTGAGRTDANTGMTMSGSATKTLDGRTLRVFGTATWTGTGTFTLQNAATFFDGGVFDAQNDTNIVNGGGAASTFNNAGTFKKATTAGITSIGVPVTAGGNINATTGTIDLAGGGSATATMNIASAGTISFSAGTFALNAATPFSSTGTLQFSGAAVNVGNSVSLPAATLSGGSLASASTVTLSGLLTWNGGSISGTGKTIANGGITINSTNGVTLDTQTLSLASVANWTGGNFVLANASVLSVTNTGTFNINCDALVSVIGSAPTINNAGLFKKSGGAGSTGIGASVIFNNTGTLQALAGTLGFAGPVTQTAGSTTLNGGALTYSTFNLQGGTFSGAGTATGNLSNTGGAVSPGLSGASHTPGILTLAGNYTQGSTGTANINIGGTSPSLFDQIQVTGGSNVATLSGILNLTFINGFTSSPGQSFPVVTYPSHSGTFITINGLTAPLRAVYTATALNIINPSVDLSLTDSGSPASVSSGSNVTYTVTVTNNGTADATGVVLTDTIPTGTTLVSATPGQGSCTGTTTVTCNLGGITNGSNVVTTIVVQTSGSGTITNNASVTGNEPDPNSGNNSQQASTNVTSLAPTVASVSPTSGRQAGNDSITITGSNFTAAGAGSTTVTIGGNGATSIVVVSNTSITAKTPSGTGAQPIVVTNGNGASNNNITFTYIAPPNLTITSPAANAFINSSSVTVTGNVSGNGAAITSVTVSGATATITSGTYSATLSGLIDGPLNLNVVATDAVGNTTTVSETVTIDTTPPTISISSPAANAIVKSPLTVTGTVNDTNLASVLVNGVTATLSAGTYSATLSSLADGPLTINAVASDKAGNTRTASVNIIIDSTPPTLAISSPAANAFVSSPLTVTGTVADANLNNVVVNGVNATVNSGNYSATLTGLANGAFTISAVATDKAGNSTTVTRNVTVDNSLPTVTITSPAANAFINSGTFSVSGTVTPGGASPISSVTVNGTTATITSGTYTATLSGLSDGPVTITVVATNQAGGSTTVTRNVTVDTTNPSLTIATPAAGSVNKSPLTVTGTVSDTNLSGVTVNGTAATITSGTYSATLNTLPDGPLTLTVIASDLAGNTTRLTRNVTIDSTPPTLAITTPAAGAVVKSPFTVTGTVSDANLSSVTVNGAAATISTGFTASVTAPDGPLTITVIATDQAGNSTTVTRNVIVDSTPPTLAISTPAANAFVSSPVTVTGTVADANLNNVVVNGVTATVTAGNYSATLTGLANGAFTISAVATDQAGNSTTVTRNITIDNTQPNLTITSPAANAFINSGSFSVTGTVAAAGGSPISSVTVNGTAATITSGNYTATISGFSDGPVTITVIATNQAGGSTTVTRNVTVDTISPSLTISTPASGSVNRSPVTVTGTVSDTNLTGVTVNGAAATITSGTYSATLSGLSDGALTLTVVAADRAGNTTTLTRNITIDSTPPTLAISTPASGAVIKSPFTVTGTITDANLASLTVNGAAATVTAGAYSASVAAPDGALTITVIATDQAGNSTTVTRNVIVDSTAPTLSITAPAINAFVRTPLTVTGAVADANLSSVVVNGVAAIVSSGAYSATLTGLANGAFTISAVATDLAGNSTTVTRNVTIDNTTPNLTITTPAANAFINSGSFSVTGTVTPAGPSAIASVTVNGTVATLVSGTYSASLTGISDGPVTLTVVATDQAGGSTTVTRNVTVDTTNPSLTIATPAAGSVNKSPLTVTGTVSDTNLSGVTVNGTAATITSGTYSATLNTLPDGPLTLTVIASDLAGNTTRLTRNVTIDSTPPSLAISTPAAGAVVKSPFTVTGTVSDANLSSVTVNGAAATISTGYTASVTAPDGPLTITVIATDQAGNSTTVTRNVIVDSTPPTLAISTPAANAFVSSPVTVTGTVTDTNILGVVVNGVTATVTAGNYSATLTGLANGAFTISAVATDQAGNSTTVTRSITVDNNSPSLTITTPAANAALNSSSLAVMGTVSNAISPVASVTVNGVAATIVSGNYSAGLTSLPDGPLTLTVIATNQAGGTTTVTRNVTIDTIKPNIAISTPAANAFINTNSITVTGSASDGGSGLAGVKVNGVTATITSGTFSATLTSLPDGPLTISAIATDLAGNTSTVVRNVTIDTAAPSLAITSPAAGAVMRAPFQVTGTVSDANLSGVTVNGQPATVISGGYSITLSGIADGPLVLTIVATDLAGNTTSLTRNVIIDDTNPTLTITSPAANAFKQSPLTVTGAVADANLATVTVNGVSATVIGGNYSATLTNLPNAPLVITVIATDLAGNSTTVTSSVTISNIGPGVAITSPSSGAFLNASTQIVSGTLVNTGGGFASVTVNGVAATIINQAFITTLHNLPDGPLTLTVVGTDLAGNITTVTRNVTIDTINPALSIASPATGAVVQSPLTVTGAVSDVNLAGVTVNGVAATITAGTYTATLSGLSDGALTITVVATDLANNVTTLTRSLIADSTPPTLAVTSPANGAFIKSPLTVTGTVSDANLASVTVNGVSAVLSAGECCGPEVPVVSQTRIGRTVKRTPLPHGIASVSGSSFTATLTNLNEGALTVTVVAVDLAGNTTTVRVPVTVDNTPPALTITSPAANAFVNNPLTVTGTVTDNSSGVASVTVNGVTASVTNGTYSATLNNLPSNIDTLTVTATDVAGNVATLTRSVTAGIRAVLSSLSPNFGPQTANTSITITGSNFAQPNAGVTTVTFGGTNATGVSVVSDTTITATIPPGVGVVSVVVSNNFGVSNSLSYTYQPPPVVISLNPARGAEVGNRLVTITGQGFAPAGVANPNTVVKFGAAAATNVVVVNDTTITVNTPPGTGVSPVVVSNINGASNANVTYQYDPAPVLTSVNPVRGPIAGNTLITLTGQFFNLPLAGQPTVLVGGIAATNVQVVNATTITALTPARSAPATVNITVSNNNGTSGAVSFIYEVLPTVSSISPTFGLETGGTPVTITGVNFARPGITFTKVLFGTALATNIAVVNDTTITAVSPVNAPGLSTVTVVNDFGSAGSAVFTYFPRLTPLAIGVNPAIGPPTGNTAVVITGVNFAALGAGTPTVLFGSAPATQVVVVNDTTITATTPPGTGTVPVTISSNNGKSNLTLSFTYISAPFTLTVSKITPPQGTALGGTPVTVIGVGFGANGTGSNTNTNLLIGGIPATNLVVVNDTTITAVTPPGNGTLEVAVSNNNGTSRLVGGFTYVPVPPVSIEIGWFAPNDPNNPLPPPRGISAQLTGTNGGGGGSTGGAQGSGAVSRQVAGSRAGGVAPRAAAGVLSGYNVYRGFTSNFQITDSTVTRITPQPVPATVLDATDSASALSQAQGSGLGVPFYRVTAIYRLPNGQLVESQPSEVATFSLLITDVSVTTNGNLIQINGVGFSTFRAVVEINGQQFTQVNFPISGRQDNGTSTSITILDKTGTLIPVGSVTKITVLNPGVTIGSGTRSAQFIYRRLAPPPITNRILR